MRAAEPTHDLVISGRKLFSLLLVFAYVFDEVMNGLINFNISGIAILMVCSGMLYVASRRGGVSITRKGLLYFLGLLLFSLLAFGSPLGCAAELKGVSSLVLLAMLFFMFRRLHLERVVADTKIANGILACIAILLVLDYFGIGVRTILLGFSKGAGPYSETSHLAMYFMPILLYRLLLTPYDWPVLAMFAAGLLLAPSSTLLVGLMLVLALYVVTGRIPFARSLSLIVAAMLMLGFAYWMQWVDLSNTINRVQNIFTGYAATTVDHTNISSLVWLNGWSQAFQTLNETGGLGTGFNQMGCGRFAEVGAFSPLFLKATGTVLNFNDGSILVSKMVAEMGVWGIGTAACLTVMALHAISKISRLFNNKVEPVHFIRAAGGACVLLFLYVRGASYFQLPLLVALSMLFVPRAGRLDPQDNSIRQT